MSPQPPVHPETTVVSRGRPAAVPGAPLNLPVTLASTYRRGDLGSGTPVYSRDDATPNWAALEEVVGDLEGGRAVSFASGMAAVDAVLELVPPGGLVVLPDDCYMGVRHLVEDGVANGRWRMRTAAGTDDAAVRKAVADGAALLWVETPSNPLMEVADVAALVAVGHEAGAVVVVDNTFATPLRQRPLALGADLAVHSATKFIGGHSDLLLGVAVAASDEHEAHLLRRRGHAGATPGALESYLALRGVRTLAVRLAAAEANAVEIARRLAAHPRVVRVRYPGLPDDPGYERSRRQSSGPGAVLSFELADAAAADAACRAVRVIGFATSLGGVETTLERRAAYAGQEHVPAGLIRMSVGIEHIDDLWADLARALDAT